MAFCKLSLSFFNDFLQGTGRYRDVHKNVLDGGRFRGRAKNDLHFESDSLNMAAGV